jgi:hypothetical protein
MVFAKDKRVEHDIYNRNAISKIISYMHISIKSKEMELVAERMLKII